MVAVFVGHCGGNYVVAMNHAMANYLPLTALLNPLERFHVDHHPLPIIISTLSYAK